MPGHNSTKAGQRPALLSAKSANHCLKRTWAHLEKAEKNWYNLSNTSIHRSATIAAQAPLLRHRRHYCGTGATVAAQVGGPKDG
jgi:hypothetical protein